MVYQEKEFIRLPQSLYGDNNIAMVELQSKIVPYY